MKASVEEISPVKKRVLIEIDSGDVEKKIEQAFKEVGRKAKIKGFRPGKIPRQILERHYGSQIMSDVANDLIQETFPKALEELNTFPLGVPSVERDVLKRGEDFKYSAVMEVRPQFEVKDYIGIEVEKRKPTVTDEAVEERLEQVRKSNGKLQPVEGERGIRTDDYVVLDYQAFEGDEPLEGIKAENFFLKVGSNDFHSRFESALVGMKKGEEADISVDFEENYYHGGLAGRTVRFHVKIVDVKEMALPELNDEFAQNLGADFKDLNALREKIRETVEAEEERKSDRELKQKIVQKISEGVDFELPDVLVEAELDSSVETLRQNLMRSGSSFEKAGISEVKLRDDLREPSRKRVKEMLVLAAIAEQNDLKVEGEDLSEGLSKLAAASGQDPEVLRRYYEARNLMGSLRQNLLEEKTLNYLVRHANIKEVENTQ